MRNFLIGILILLSCSVNALDFTGKAYFLDGEPAYHETHSFIFKQGEVVRGTTKYFDMQDALVGELNSDFSRYAFVPTYRFKDYRNNVEHGLTFTANEYQAFIRKEYAEQRYVMALNDKTLLSSGQGLHFLIEKNFEQLLAQESPLELDFVIPTRGKTYPFRIKRVSQSQSKVVFRVEVNVWYARIFAPHFDVTYDIKTKRLEQYVGPTILADKEGKIKTVKIVYEY